MNNALSKLIDEIFSDGKISPKELMELKKLSERAVIDLLQIDGDDGTTNALCKSFEVTNQLLQLTLLNAKRKDDDYQQALSDMIDSQIELMRSNYQLFNT